MVIKEYSREYKLKLLEAFNMTKDLGCPPEQYRVPKHTKCFYCNECWRYALANSIEEEKKVEPTELEKKINKLMRQIDEGMSLGGSFYINQKVDELKQKLYTLQQAQEIIRNE